MRRVLWLTFLAVSLIVFGCDSSETPVKKQETTPQPAVKTEQKAEVKEAVSATQSTVAAQEVTNMAEKNAEQTKSTAEEVISTVKEKTEEALETVAVVKKDVSNSITEASTTAVAEAVNTVKEEESSVAQVSPPQEIVLDASYGKVTFPHATHAEAYECSICHKEASPEAFGINKEIAHKLCKGCHKDEGAGPTGCKGCHVK